VTIIESVSMRLEGTPADRSRVRASGAARALEKKDPMPIPGAPLDTDRADRRAVDDRSTHCRRVRRRPGRKAGAADATNIESRVFVASRASRRIHRADGKATSVRYYKRFMTAFRRDDRDPSCFSSARTSDLDGAFKITAGLSKR